MPNRSRLAWSAALASLLVLPLAATRLHHRAADHRPVSAGAAVAAPAVGRTEPRPHPHPRPMPVPSPGRSHQPHRPPHHSRSRVALRTRPSHVTRGHYLRSLTGHSRDLVAMRALGARDAAANPGGTAHVVLLDIGGQWRWGVVLSMTHRFIANRSLVRALNAYVQGYHSRQHRNAPVTIALGTNNDLTTSARAGLLWARDVVSPVRARAARFRDITIAGADDIEPGFSAGPRSTRSWVRGFLTNTAAPLVFNGSADGCSPRRAFSRCNRGWTTRDLAEVAGGMAPSRIVALPQIYNPTMARQWAQIARAMSLLHHHPLRVIGPLTETAACHRDPSCPTMPSYHAWRLLWVRLRQVHVPLTSLPAQVDLDVK